MVLFKGDRKINTLCSMYVLLCIFFIHIKFPINSSFVGTFVVVPILYLVTVIES